MMICGRNTSTLPTPAINPFCRKLCSSRGRLRAAPAPPACPARRRIRQQLHQRLRPGEHGLEHHEQNEREDRDSADRMQHHGIDARGQRVRLARHRDGVADDAVGLALQRLHLGQASGFQPSPAVSRPACWRRIRRCACAIPSTPAFFTAIEVMTGTPSAADIASTSMLTPRRCAMSNMLSTTSSGGRCA
jgi:hypothetical protein